MQKEVMYPLKKRLVMQVLEEFRGDDREDMDAGKTADYLQEISHSEVNQCWYCGKVGIDVTRYAILHVGGIGEVPKRCCENGEECIRRVELEKSRRRYERTD